MSSLFSSSSASSSSILRPSSSNDHPSSSSSAPVFQSNLSCVLNDPRKTRAELASFFTKTWGNSFIDRPIDPLSRLGDFSLADFEIYFQSLRQSEKYGRPRLVQQSATNDSALQTEKSNSITNIPQLFFSSQFTLNDFSTFNLVYPGIIPPRNANGTSVAPPPPSAPPSNTPADPQGSAQKSRTTSTSSEKSDGSTIRRQSAASNGLISSPSTKHSISSTSRLLQDKYTHYLDEIELLITRALATKSDCFHDAVRSHDEIQMFLHRTRSAISSLRSQLIEHDEKSLLRLLRLSSFLRQRRNQRQILKRLQSLSLVRQTHSQVRTLLTTNDYLSALDLIDVTKETLASELSDLLSLRFSDQQLTELYLLIVNLIREEFQQSLNNYFHVDDTQLNSSPAFPPHFDEDKFVTILIGLIRVHDEKFFELFRTKVEAFLFEFGDKTVKTFAKDLQTNKLPSKHHLDPSGDELSSPLRPSPSSTTGYSHWSRLIQHLFRSLEKCFDYLEILSQLIFDTLSKQNSKHVAQYLTLMENIYEKSEERLIDILSQESTRFQIHFERLSLDEYSQLIQLIQSFVENKSFPMRNSSSGSSRTRPLKTFLQDQTSQFLNYFHDERKQRLSATLENEQWKQVPIPRPIQNSIDESFGSSSSSSSVPPSAGTETLNVDDEQFVLCSSSLHLFMLVLDYRSCAQLLPSSSIVDVEHRLIELLKLFNSKSCQLVLGAGAVKLGRIRTISAKILALTCRCLQFVKLLLPKIKAHFDQLQSAADCPSSLSSLSTTKQFEQLTRLYSEHIDEIHGKLISIIESTFGDTLSSYEVRAPMPSDCFRTLVTRHIAAFYNAVARIVSPSDLVLLFTRLNSIFKHVLAKRLRQLRIANDGGPQHGLLTSDLLYYIKQVQSLPGLEMLELHVDEIWTTN